MEYVVEKYENFVDFFNLCVRKYFEKKRKLKKNIQIFLRRDYNS